jgi:hypothetical protein
MVWAVEERELGGAFVVEPAIAVNDGTIEIPCDDIKEI